MALRPKGRAFLCFSSLQAVGGGMIHYLTLQRAITRPQQVQLHGKRSVQSLYSLLLVWHRVQILGSYIVEIALRDRYAAPLNSQLPGILDHDRFSFIFLTFDPARLVDMIYLALRTFVLNFNN